jgi:hypothetical protein
MGRKPVIALLGLLSIAIMLTGCGRCCRPVPEGPPGGLSSLGPVEGNPVAQKDSGWNETPQRGRDGKPTGGMGAALSHASGRPDTLPETSDPVRMPPMPGREVQPAVAIDQPGGLNHSDFTSTSPSGSEVADPHRQTMTPSFETSAPRSPHMPSEGVDPVVVRRPRFVLPPMPVSQPSEPAPPPASPSATPSSEPPPPALEVPTQAEVHEPDSLDPAPLPPPPGYDPGQ